jgi:isopentenyldiphosphate isomerase
MSTDVPELWQAYDAQGRPIAEKGLTKAVARDGALHGAAHVWIWRESDTGQREILLQKRAADKPTWPGFYDISAAGHIDFGETPLQAVVREAQEELGLTVSDRDLSLVFVHRRNITDQTSGYIENEFCWVYILQLAPHVKIGQSDGEVDEVKWVSDADFARLREGNLADMVLVPQGDVYFDSLMHGLSLSDQS